MPGLSYAVLKRADHFEGERKTPPLILLIWICDEIDVLEVVLETYEPARHRKSKPLSTHFKDVSLSYLEVFEAIITERAGLNTQRLGQITTGKRYEGIPDTIAR